MIRYLIIVILSVLLTGCAGSGGLSGMFTRMGSFFRNNHAHAYAPAVANVCDVNGAYRMGIVDGSNHQSMRSDIAVSCAAEKRAELKQAYQHGYQEGIHSNPEYLPRDAGQQRDDYAVHETSTAAVPKKQCVRTVAGQVCGYQCLKSFDTAKCSSFPGDNCVKDANGAIQCGKNCRIEASGQILCDINR